MKKVGEIIVAVSMMLFIICASVTAVLNFKPLYRYDMKKLNLSQTSGYSEEAIYKSYCNLIDYNMFWGGDTLEFEGIPMSEHGRIHFIEVKEIFVAFQFAGIAAFIVAAAGTAIFIRKKEYGFLKLSAFITVIIPTILGALIAWRWDFVFITFHKLCFDNDYWIFDPAKDPIINVLPDMFFFHSAVGIVALVIIGSIVCFAVYTRLNRKTKKISG